MAAVQIPLVLLFMPLVTMATVAQSPVPANLTSLPEAINGLTIMSNSADLQLGLTDQLNITCTFSRSGRPSIVSVVSLVVSRWSEEDKDFQELLSLTSFRPDAVTVLESNISASVQGHLDQYGESFITLHWNVPSNFVPKRYLCDVTTLDTSGHPINELVGVDVKLPDVGATVCCAQMRTSMAHLGQRLQTQNDVIRDLSRALEEQRNITEDLRRSLLRVHDDRFVYSGVTISGYKLYFSKVGFEGIYSAQINCAIIGGKLADFSQKELQSVSNDLQRGGMYGWFWLGITNDGSAWSSITSFKPVDSTYEIQWYNAPGDLSENCLTFNPGATGYYAVQCGAIQRVLCAVPVN